MIYPNVAFNGVTFSHLATFDASLSEVPGGAFSYYVNEALIYDNVVKKFISITIENSTFENLYI